MKKNTSKKLYVAYGSNLHLEQMRHRCPDAEVYGAGVIKNYSLTFWGNRRGNGVATILPEAITDVPVAVWSISKNDERALDCYEGFPHLYRKENIDVLLDTGETVTGMVYIMNYGEATVPSGYYYNTIKSGYESFGFDVDFLKKSADNVYRLQQDEDRIMFKYRGRHLVTLRKSELGPGDVSTVKEILAEKMHCSAKDISTQNYPRRTKVS